MVYYVLLKALPPVCMKYTAGDEHEAKRKQSGSVLSVLLYFTLT